METTQNQIEIPPGPRRWVEAFGYTFELENETPLTIVQEEPGKFVVSSSSNRFLIWRSN